MTDDDQLVRRVIAGDSAAVADLRRRVATSPTADLLVAAALTTDEPADLLEQAARAATTSRDRQLVALAVALVDGEDGRLDALVRDHLSDHPDHVLAAWIATRPTPRER